MTPTIEDLQASIKEQVARIVERQRAQREATTAMVAALKEKAGTK